LFKQWLFKTWLKPYSLQWRKQLNIDGKLNFFCGLSKIFKLNKFHKLMGPLQCLVNSIKAEA
jgi:hypothetical protein